jgi:hypothetical protein
LPLQRRARSALAEMPDRLGIFQDQNPKIAKSRLKPVVAHTITRLTGGPKSPVGQHVSGRSDQDRVLGGGAAFPLVAPWGLTRLTAIAYTLST